MTNEQTKTQELLAILQTRPWTKAERALVRQQIRRYYERKLADLQRALFEAIGLNAPTKLTPFEVDEYIHRYHKQSQELYVYMNYRSSSNEWTRPQCPTLWRFARLACRSSALIAPLRA